MTVPAYSNDPGLPHPAGAQADSLHERLLYLRRHERSAWRCLRTLTTFSDFAHLARRLHFTHGELHARLKTLGDQLGTEHLWLEAGHVRASNLLLDAISRADVRSVSASRQAHRIPPNFNPKHT